MLDSIEFASCICVFSVIPIQLWLMTLSHSHAWPRLYLCTIITVIYFCDRIVWCIFTVVIVIFAVVLFLLSSHRIVMVFPLMFEYGTGVVSVQQLPKYPSTHPPQQWPAPRMRGSILHMLMSSLQADGWATAPRNLQWQWYGRLMRLMGENVF